MIAVVVSSPGRAADRLHWSHGMAAAVAERLAGAGCDVHWLAAVQAGQVIPAPPPRVARTVLARRGGSRLHRVARANRDLALEVALTTLLRAHPAAPVVHAGLGAGGSPNVPWLAERMGSPSVVVARSAEVVCHRGDLVDAQGEPCARFLDAARCARCCSAPLRRASRAALLARTDLLVASLLAAGAVFVPDGGDAAPLVAFGVPQRAIVVGSAPDTIAARVLA